MTDPELGWNDQIKAQILKVTENWIVGVVPMLYNDRVVLMDKNEWQSGYTAGFCYDKGGAAVIAALVWDPEDEFYPKGYKKIACDARKKG